MKYVFQTVPQMVMTRTGRRLSDDEQAKFDAWFDKRMDYPPIVQAVNNAFRELALEAWIMALAEDK